VPGFTNAYAKPNGVFGAAQKQLPERKGSGGIEIQEADLSQCAGSLSDADRLIPSPRAAPTPRCLPHSALDVEAVPEAGSFATFTAMRRARSTAERRISRTHYHADGLGSADHSISTRIVSRPMQQIPQLGVGASTPQYLRHSVGRKPHALHPSKVRRISTRCFASFRRRCRSLAASLLGSQWTTPHARSRAMSFLAMRLYESKHAMTVPEFRRAIVHTHD
jgi:hypothetical protein